MVAVRGCKCGCSGSGEQANWAALPDVCTSSVLHMLLLLLLAVLLLPTAFSLKHTADCLRHFHS
jgi:hypothetical protein